MAASSAAVLEDEDYSGEEEEEEEENVVLHAHFEFFSDEERLAAEQAAGQRQAQLLLSARRRLGESTPREASPSPSTSMSGLPGVLALTVQASTTIDELSRFVTAQRLFAPADGFDVLSFDERRLLTDGELPVGRLSSPELVLRARAGCTFVVAALQQAKRLQKHRFDRLTLDEDAASVRSALQRDMLVSPRDPLRSSLSQLSDSLLNTASTTSLPTHSDNDEEERQRQPAGRVSLLGSLVDLRELLVDRQLRSSVGSGLVTQLARFIHQEQWAELGQLLDSVPAESLLSSLPVLVSLRQPVVVDFLRRQCAAAPRLAARVKLFQMGRRRFEHLAPLAEQLPSSRLIELLLDPEVVIEPGLQYDVESEHPISGQRVQRVRVQKVFGSLARPAVLSFEPNDEPVLFKRGEDIYHESCIQCLFRVMNEVWTELLPPCVRPFVCGFHELPAGKKHGFLHIVDGVRDLEEIELGGFAAIVDHDNFVRTSCGWIVAAYVLGLSDRHRENTLVRLADSSAVPIDFGFMLGNQPPGTNTYSITVSPDFYAYLLARGDDTWPRFAAMFLAAVWALRQHAAVFVNLAASMFSGTSRDLRILRAFISTRLMTADGGAGIPDTKALPAMVKMLRHAPVCHDTRKKINDHAKNKLFLQRHGGNFIVGLVIKRAVEAKPKVDTDGTLKFHRGRVPLQLPPVDSFPEPLPPPLSLYFEALRATNNRSCTLPPLTTASAPVVAQQQQQQQQQSFSPLSLFKTPSMPNFSFKSLLDWLPSRTESSLPPPSSLSSSSSTDSAHQ